MFTSGAACLILGFTSDNDSLQTEAIPPHIPKIPNSRQRSVHAESSGSVSYTAEGTKSRTTELARIMFMSPWFSIVIQLLTGHESNLTAGDQWIYPFKYLLLYAKQIKLFVQLLDGLQLDSLQVGDMLPTLTQVITQVAASLGPERIDFTHSIDSTAKIVLKDENDFRIHIQKVERSSPADAEMEEPDEGTDQKLTSRHDTGIGHSDEKWSKAAEHESLHLRCTCLKDARDHLQLLCNVIDDHLSDLLLLHTAISNHSIKRIKFRDLWLLYNPGDLVVSSKAPLQAYRVTHVCGGRPLMTKFELSSLLEPERASYQDHSRKFRVSPLKIDCVRFDFYGDVFGPVQTTVDIFPFDDERSIVELEVYPVDFAENKSALKKTLLMRGRRFAAFGDFKHQNYAGLSLGDPPEEVRRNRKSTSLCQRANTLLNM